MRLGAIVIATLFALAACRGESVESDQEPRDEIGAGASGDTSVGGDTAESADAGAIDTGAPIDGDAIKACPRGAGVLGTTAYAEANPRMLFIPTKKLCIDRVEVTNAAYNVFLITKPLLKAPTIPAFCETRREYGLTRPSNRAPATNVEWCHAYEYCKWMGKHLCGKHGGGALAESDGMSPSVSQWSYACRGGDPGTAYPYGATHKAGVCVVDPTFKGPKNYDDAPYGTTCVGGFPGLLHMSGNIDEWEDACNGPAGPSISCRIRGGHYASDATLNQDRCDHNATAFITVPRDEIGFRCCAEADVE